MLDAVTTNEPAEHRDRSPSAPGTVDLLPNDLVSVLRIFSMKSYSLQIP